MTSPTARSIASRRDSEVEFHSWEILLLLGAASVLLAWYNTNEVMTREMYYLVLGDQLDGSRIDVQYDLAQRWAVWGYVAVPFILWLRVAVVATVTQLVLLMTAGDIGIGRIFRLTALAQIPLFVGGAVRILWLARLAPEEITRGTIAASPLSLAYAVYPTTASAEPLYQLLSMVNVFELAWVVWLALGLVRLMRLSLPKASLVAGGVWLSFTVLQWSLSVYLSSYS